MTQTLNVAVLPLDIAWADRSENLFALEQAMAQLKPGTDLVVLPELFSTGFIADMAQALDHACQTDDRFDSTLAVLRRLSAQYCTAIAASYLKRADDGRPQNHAVLVEPSGEHTVYDKHHLFCLSPESRCYSPGQLLPPVVRYRGWNICMIVCYDLRFPAWCRNRDLRYDLLLVPANWPTTRAYAWNHLLIARAIENQAYVIGANRSGRDDYGEYDGMSQVYDFMGKPIGQFPTPDVPASWFYATLSKEQLDHYRSSIPFHKDADRFIFE